MKHCQEGKGHAKIKPADDLAKCPGSAKQAKICGGNIATFHPLSYCISTLLDLTLC